MVEEEEGHRWPRRLPPRPCPLLLSVLVAAVAGVPPDSRFVLCDDGGPLPTARLSGGLRLRAVAGSIAAAGPRLSGAAAERRWLRASAVRPQLRLALLVDGRRFTAHLPSGLAGLPHAGLGQGESYAKCRGAALANTTRIGCRVVGGFGDGAGAVPYNVTAWRSGRLVRFRNEEFLQDFALCNLAHARSSVGQAMRLRVDVSVAPPNGASTVLQVELCRVTRPLISASICSQPLYGLHRMQRDVPWVFEDWLAYHLQYLGFQHAEIYDVDGSFADAMHPWIQGQRGQDATVRYHHRWPDKLSEDMRRVSEEHPYCAEMWAYAHCLTTHRALSRWVVLLHSPDEYMVVRANPNPGILSDVLKLVVGEDDGMYVGQLHVQSFSFGKGGPGTEAWQLSGRGGVVGTSFLRNNKPYVHVPIADAANCMAAGPHGCYRPAPGAEAGAGAGAGAAPAGAEAEAEALAEAEAEAEAVVEQEVLSKEVRPALLLVNHYVEMLASNTGRCASLVGQPCETPDNSAGWLAAWLHAGAAGGGAAAPP